MTLETPLLLSGAPGSPYTRKMLAVLRYRHIPYRFLLTGHNVPDSLPKPKVALLPTFYLKEGDGVTKRRSTHAADPALRKRSTGAMSCLPIR